MVLPEHQQERSVQAGLEGLSVNVHEQVNAIYALDAETHVLADLDDEWAVPCEAMRHTGNDPAAWIMWPTCCTVAGNPNILVCDPCKTRKLESGISILCDDCGMVYTPASTAWRLIEPLNRRAT